MDICHYNFPGIIDSVLRGIGELKPVESFEGCGSFTPGIKSIIEKELSVLINSINSLCSLKETGKPFMLKAWLYASLAKTIKEQAGLKRSLPGLV